MDDQLEAGRVGRPHGLDGSFRVTRPRGFLLALEGRVSIAGEEREILRRDGTDAEPILRLSGCESRAAAEVLRGETLWVAAGDSPALESGEYYAEQLEGCLVVTGGDEVGVVEGLLELPSCEALQVRRGGGGATLLVPMVRDAIRSIDVDARRIEIDLRFVEGER